ncbi:energy transducer TonB [Croceiramulus getboli]|nr:energy transducer TonB [Flavobacteriaceae bacterium YJPT1-3]
MNTSQNGTQARQSLPSTTRKHDVNLRKRGIIPFQVGLILTLLLVLLVFEIRTPTRDLAVAMEPVEEFTFREWNEHWEVEKAPAEEPSTTQDRTQPTEAFEEVPDDTKVIEALEFKNEPPNAKAAVDPSTIVEAADEEVPDEVDFIRVEDVPVYPGCEGFTDNADRRQCMQDKITAHVNRYFETELASRLGLKGIQRIYVQFKIDTKGEVTDIQARAPHPALAKEAQRVIDKLPVMTPGMQRKTPVGVRYTMPIIYQIRD